MDAKAESNKTANSDGRGLPGQETSRNGIPAYGRELVASHPGTFGRAMLQGISSVGLIYRRPKVPPQAGSIESDLEVIGRDFRRAIGCHETEKETASDGRQDAPTKHNWLPIGEESNPLAAAKSGELCLYPSEANVRPATSSVLLPPPTMFGCYEEALPGAAKRIIQLTEREQSHRQELQNVAAEIHRANVRRGHWMGFALGIAGIIAALICAIYDRPVIAGLTAISVIAGVAGACVKGRDTVLK